MVKEAGSLPRPVLPWLRRSLGAAWDRLSLWQHPDSRQSSGQAPTQCHVGGIDY